VVLLSAREHRGCRHIDSAVDGLDDDDKDDKEDNNDDEEDEHTEEAKLGTVNGLSINR